jgi:glycosyltransferase involved in cell wall biosynthesis
MLVAQGHEVLWWASTFDHRHKKHRFNEPSTVESFPGLKVRLLHGPGYRQNKSIKRFLHQRAIARAFAKEVMDFQCPDIIVCGLPLPELAEQALIFGKKFNLPVVIDVRDRWPDIYLTMFSPGLRRLARLALVSEFRRIRWVFQSASAILSVSKTYLNWALSYADRPVRSMDGVFPLGYHAPDSMLDEADAAKLRRKYCIHPKSLVITYVGAFGFSYDLETVVNVAKNLHEKGEKDIRIMLIGDGDSASRLHELGCGLPNLIFTGWLDQESILSLLRISSVGLAAYKKEATQTLPNKPFEYMAVGLPLLSSLRGELEDLIRTEKIGLQYQAGNADSLVEKIGWLAAHPEERQAMGQRSRKLFEERFNAEIIYPKLVQHLERIAKNA